MFDLQAYQFSSSDGGNTYTRNLFGLEALACTCAAHGMYFFWGCCAVQLPRSISDQHRVLGAVRDAWVQLRFLSPAIALKVSRSPDCKDSSWIYEYTVPQSKDQLEEWTNATIVRHEAPLTMTALEADLSSQTVSYTEYSGYALKLHIAPFSESENAWILAVHRSHANIDGRSAMALLGRLSANTRYHLVNDAMNPVVHLEWGKEVVRLTGPGVVLTGISEKILSSNTGPGSSSVPAPLLTEVPFFVPPLKVEDVEGEFIAKRFCLGNTQTSRFRQVFRERGRTATHVITSVIALVHVEATLMNAKRRGRDRFNTILECYRKATHWTIPNTAKDQRPSFEKNATIHSPEGTVLCAVHGYGISIPMASIRSALAFDEITETCARYTEAAFWDGVVQDHVSAFGQLKLENEDYVHHEASFHELSRAFSPAPWFISAAATTSIGDIDVLGYFEDMKPTGDDGFAVVDVSNSLSYPTPIIFCSFWQYNRKLTFYFYGSPRYYTSADLETLAVTFEAWISMLLPN